MIGKDAPLPSESIVLKTVIGFLYPFMLLLGFFIILNGQNTPGGGFQGGCILASLLVARYVVFPVNDIQSEKLHFYQRFTLCLILLIPVLFLFSGFLKQNPQYNLVYLRTMDILIGIQVGLEISVAVLRFSFFGGVGKRWKL